MLSLKPIFHGLVPPNVKCQRRQCVLVLNLPRVLQRNIAIGAILCVVAFVVILYCCSEDRDMLHAKLTILQGAWHATINTEGDGEIGYGAGLGVKFLPKTFDMQATNRELQPHLSRKPATVEDRDRVFGRCYGITYYTNKHPKGVFYFTGGPAPIDKIFERFKVACREGMAGERGKMIEKFWHSQPPTPISKPWDAEDEESKKLTLRVGVIDVKAYDQRDGIWTAVVRRDGSGYIQLGFALPPLADFPAGAFDPKTILSHLEPRLVLIFPANHGIDEYFVRIIGEDKKGQMMWAKEPDPIAEVFELFRQAYKQGKSASRSKAFPEAWRRHPPTKVSHSWDDEVVKTKNEKP
jgi:hypothetical protein